VKEEGGRRKEEGGLLLKRKRSKLVKRAPTWALTSQVLDIILHISVTCGCLGFFSVL